MTSMERVLCALSHKTPDRIPLMLLLSMYGAKELNMSIKEYFSSADNIVNAQLKMKEKYNNDCIYTFFYAPIEVEAYGGEVIFYEDGPPNSGIPFIKNAEQIDSLEVPSIEGSPCLKKVLEATEKLKSKVGDTVPIIGVVMSPFSVPVMQMGFENYLKLLYFDRARFDVLMEKNMEFCINWANAQIQAGATAICYFDPLASPNIIDRKTYLETGHIVAKKTIEKINGPTATHLASGIALPVIEDLIETKTTIVGVGPSDDIALLKEKAGDRLTFLGNLNGIDMVNWNNEDAEKYVKKLIASVGDNGGFIISDSHGEIPWQVTEEVLLAISKTVGESELDFDKLGKDNENF